MSVTNLRDETLRSITELYLRSIGDLDEEQQLLARVSLESIHKVWHCALSDAVKIEHLAGESRVRAVERENKHNRERKQEMKHLVEALQTAVCKSDEALLSEHFRANELQALVRALNAQINQLQARLDAFTGR